MIAWNMLAFLALTDINTFYINVSPCVYLFDFVRPSSP